jgi:hypothetical protein
MHRHLAGLLLLGLIVHGLGLEAGRADDPAPAPSEMARADDPPAPSDQAASLEPAPAPYAITASPEPPLDGGVFVLPTITVGKYWYKLEPVVPQTPKPGHPLQRMVLNCKCYCWAHHDLPGSGSFQSEWNFLWGSTRTFFGDPCLKGRPAAFYNGDFDYSEKGCGCR